MSEVTHWRDEQVVICVIICLFVDTEAVVYLSEYMHLRALSR
jgi:hypothetical protein